MSLTGHHHKVNRELSYRRNIMAGLAVVLALTILLVKFWPVQERVAQVPEPAVFQDEVLIDDVMVTRQPSAPPPPVRPTTPQPEPVDEIIEEMIEFDTDLNLPDLPDLPEALGTGRDGDENVIVSNPQLPPSVVRIVEPSVPELPSELRGRIVMVVNFLVNIDGTVEEASIVEIRQYDADREEYEVLPFIQYGLIGTTLEAALNWRFRAARHEGSGVRTYTTATFNY